MALSAMLTSSLEAQWKKRAAQLAFCAGGGVIGMKLGDQLVKVAQRHATQLQMTPTQVVQYRRQIQVGTAAILCLSGSALAGSAYERLSKRDLEARKREIETAVQESDPISRDYVLPESQRTARVTTEAPYKDGDRECKRVIDQLADVAAGEQAVATYCRSPGGTYELEF
jgi:hypothetical protein